MVLYERGGKGDVTMNHMKFYRNDELDFDGKTCCFEEYDKASKSMRPCGKETSVLVKKSMCMEGLCREHALLLIDESSDCFVDRLNPVTGKHVWDEVPARNFLKLVKGTA